MHNDKSSISISTTYVLVSLVLILGFLSYWFAINIMPDLNNAMQVVGSVVWTPNAEQPNWTNERFLFWPTWWYINWNVGLGTKVPWPYKLFVQWDTNIEWKLTTNDLEIENNLHVQWNLSASGATTLWWPLWVYGPTKIDGRVGIWVNTLSTYYKLEVNGPTNIQWDLFAPNINASANVNVSWDVKIDNDAYWRDAYFRNLNANGGVNVSGDVRVNTDVYGRDAYFRNLFASGWFFSGLVADTITWWNWFFSGLSVGNLVVSWSFTLPPGDEDQVLMTKNWEADRHTLPLDLTWASGQTLRRVDGKWTKSSVLQNLWNKVLITTDASIEWWMTIWDKNVACNATEQWTVRYDWSCFWWCNGSTWTTIGTCSCAANEYHEPDVWCVSNNAQNGSCVSYPSTYGAQPAIDTVSACTIWIYTDTTDTYNQRKRSCMGVQWWATVSCSANKDARCGNWVRDTGEMCDDWDRTDWDWCNASCNVEPGRNCVWSPSMCVNAIWSGDDGDTLVIASWQVVTSKVIRNLWTQVIINQDTAFEKEVYAQKWVTVGFDNQRCNVSTSWLVVYDWVCFVWCNWIARNKLWECNMWDNIFTWWSICNAQLDFIWWPWENEFFLYWLHDVPTWNAVFVEFDDYIEPDQITFSSPYDQFGNAAGWGFNWPVKHFRRSPVIDEYLIKIVVQWTPWSQTTKRKLNTYCAVSACGNWILETWEVCDDWYNSNLCWGSCNMSCSWFTEDCPPPPPPPPPGTWWTSTQCACADYDTITTVTPWVCTPIDDSGWESCEPDITTTSEVCVSRPSPPCP